MCLTNFRSEVNLLTHKVKSTKKKYYYKVVDLHGNYLTSPVYLTQYKPGIIKSSSRVKNTEKYRMRGYNKIGPGIHVFLTKKDAENSGYLHSTRIVIKVEAFIDDLLGCNYSQAVFKKVFLSEKEYKRALRKKV